MCEQYPNMGNFIIRVTQSTDPAKCLETKNRTLSLNTLVQKCDFYFIEIDVTVMND